MGYYTAAPRTLSYEIGNIVWKEGEYCVREMHDRMWLYKRDFQVAELIYGKSGLDKYHKGKFENWIESVKKKDLKKAQGMIEKANKVLEEAKEIQALWDT